jgi:hypothetical protein
MPNVALLHFMDGVYTHKTSMGDEYTPIEVLWNNTREDAKPIASPVGGKAPRKCSQAVVGTSADTYPICILPAS